MTGSKVISGSPPKPLFVERIAVRFGATLLANLLRSSFSFLSGILLARGLGTSHFGDLSFLLGSFIAIGQLLEVGTSSAFYTFISQRRRKSIFFVCYFGWISLQLLVPFFVVGLILPYPFIEKIWLGHSRGIILLAFMASFLMNQGWLCLSQLGEAVRKTVFVQTAAVFQALIHCVLIGLATWGHILTVPLTFALLIGEYLILALFLMPRLIKANVSTTEIPENFKTVLSAFIKYCKPMVIYCWVGFLYTFADRWMLQRFGGSAQQAFFSVGQQFANISLIATTSILMVLWKEIAEARNRNDLKRIETLYHNTAKRLYFCGAWISCLLIPYSREILIWTLGANYEGAAICLSIMFLYPIHQALGQIHGTFFYASEATGNYAKIGLTMMILSIPATYLVLAPHSTLLLGLGLGAMGLALKMVIHQIVGVNIQSYVIARSHQWRYDYLFQIVVLGLLLALATLSKFSGSFVASVLFQSNEIVKTALGLFFYGCLSLVLTFRFPELTGFSSQHFQDANAFIKRHFSPLTVASKL